MSRASFRCAFFAPCIAGMILQAAAVAAQDCAAPVADTVISVLFGAAQMACDPNGDGKVSAADLTAAVLAVAMPTPTPSSSTATPTGGGSPTSTPMGGLSPQPSPTETPTSTPSSSPPTHTSTATVTMTPTPAVCPTTGAELQIEIDNQTGNPSVSVTLSGARLGTDCLPGATMATDYTVTLGCSGTGIVSCAQVSDLAPGFWRHSISVTNPNTRQLQHQTSLLVTGSASNRLRFTAFASVRSVRTAANTGDGSLRNVLQFAASDTKPLLIQFAPTAFPDGIPTAIQLQFQLPTLATDDVTIDGTDAMGETGNRIIDAQGDAGVSVVALAITGARNHVVGMRLRNAGQNNRDVLNISGATADGNVIERSVIENTASSDGIGVDAQAGKDFGDSANVIRDCVITGAADKGVKVTLDAYVRVEQCWIHDNKNGGIQATLGGHVQSSNNLVERNLGSTAQNGLSVAPPDNGSPSTASSQLFSQGDISRGNGANGLAVHDQAFADVRNDYLATNATAGIRVFNDAQAPTASARVEGTSAVCNGVDGAVVSDASVADFGDGALGSPGNNAFTQNNLPAGGANLRNATMPPLTVSAINSQWEHCGGAMTCDDAAIAAYDLSDHGANTTYSPSQAHRSQQAPVLTSVAPAKGRRGELLRIFGTGFNVIDGHFSEKDMQCADVAGRNRCLPVRGNCVRIHGVAAQVEAVTPTMLVVRWPFTCVEPVPLTVTIDQGPGATTSLPFTVCTNE